MKKSIGGMGFRSLRDFNVALLGNQGWRLLKYPDKLVSKIYKARYYPNGTYLNAKIGANPSFIWRSVLQVQALLKQGVRCRVGNGRSINVLDDPWLPSEHNPYIHSISESLRNQKVISLLDTVEGSWEVLDLFEERDANMILSIPVNTEENDTWYWRREKMGSYSVKSAYSLLLESKTHNHTGDNSGFWRCLWNLKIPSKVKNFLWRACSNCLPTKDFLRARKIPVNELCPSCNEAPESIVHTLVTCSYASTCLTKLALQQS